jgi:hypothetical protein
VAHRVSSGQEVRWTAGILFGLLGLHLGIRFLAVALDISFDLLTLQVEGDVDLYQARFDFELLLARIELVREIQKQIGVALVIAWLAWASACNRLARARGLALHYGPLGTIGWWFVPVANFVVPLRMTAEQWRASVAPEPGAWQTQPVSGVVLVWWFSCLATIAVRIWMLARFVNFEDSLDSFELVRSMLRHDALTHAVAILATSLALVIVSQISTGLRR